MENDIEKRDRPTFDEYCMMLAQLVSTRSTCLRRKVGAVLVKDKQIIGTGYNGAPKGAPHCEDVGCLREKNDVPSGERHELCRGAHAEANAVSQSAQHGVSTEDSTLYCTTYPCPMCAKTVINAGITEIYYSGNYGKSLADDLLEQSDIEVVKMKVPDIPKYL